VASSVFPSARTALLLIDVINLFDFPGGDAFARRWVPAARRIARLRGRAHRSGVPVVYVNDNFGRWRSDFQTLVSVCSEPERPGAAIAELLKPTPQDFFVLKPHLSGFRETPLHMLLFVSLIVFFAFFYTSIVFNPQDTAENLRKHGGFIPGIRPGQRTAEYLDYVLTRLTVVGALYLSGVCLLPEILISQYAVPFYFGGTSLLIVVSVTMDTTAQIQSHLIAHQYEGLIRKSRLRGARR